MLYPASIISHLANLIPLGAITTGAWRQCIIIVVQRYLYPTVTAFVRTLSRFFSCCRHRTSPFTVNQLLITLCLRVYQQNSTESNIQFNTCSSFLLLHRSLFLPFFQKLIIRWWRRWRWRRCRFITFFFICHFTVLLQRLLLL